MDEEAAFIAALAAEPSDRTAALVFADWLEERGDPRGPMLRIDEVRAWMHPKYANPVPELLAALESGKRVNDVTKALGLIGEPAVAGLVALLSHKQPLVRARAAKALRGMGARAKAALPALLAMVKDADYTARREAAAAAKEVVRGGAGAELLREALRDSDYSVRNQAAALLGTMRAKRAAKDELAKGLDSPDPAERLAAVKALETLYTKTAADALGKALGDESLDVRLAAVKQLNGLAGPTLTGAVEPLRRALADSEAEVRKLAAHSLGLIGPAAVAALPELLALAAREEGRERFTFIAAVVQTGVGRPEALAVALEALGNPVWRHPVCLALQQWPSIPASAAPALLEMVRKPEEGWQRSQIVRAGLYALARIPDPPPEVLEEFRAQLAGENAAAAAELLGQVGPRAAAFLPELVAALYRQGKHWWPDRIAEAIGKIGGDGIAILVETLDRGPASGPNAFPSAAVKGLKAAGPAALPALPALLARIRDRKLPGPAAILDAIAAMGPGAAAAVPELVEMFLGDELQQHSEALARALGAFGPAVLPFAPRLIEVVEQPARSRFHAPVLSLLAELVPHGFAELAVFRDGLRGAITGDGYTRPVASAAVRGLAAFGPAAAEAVPDLVTAYRTFTGYPRGDLREEALAAFGAIGGPALAHVRDALGESVWSLRLAAVNAIDASGDDSAETLAALRAAQADAAQRVRSRVATVLRKLENPKRKRG